MLEERSRQGGTTYAFGDQFACAQAYTDHVDPVTLEPYTANPSGTGGVGFDKNCTASFCTFPIPSGYAGFDPLDRAK